MNSPLRKYHREVKRAKKVGLSSHIVDYKTWKRNDRKI